VLANMRVLFGLVPTQPSHAGDGAIELMLVVARLGTATDRQGALNDHQGATIDCLGAPSTILVLPVTVRVQLTTVGCRHWP
jgi:hypothetical protein